MADSEVAYDPAIGSAPIVIPPGEGHEGELTVLVPGQELKACPGTFVLIPPGVEHGFRNDDALPVRMLNVHAPGGFDRRIGLRD